MLHSRARNDARETPFRFRRPLDDRPRGRGASALIAVILAASMVIAQPATAAPQPSAPRAEAGVTVGGLEVENRTEPLGIDVPAPRFSWITSSSQRDVVQESYRLRVSTSAADFDANVVWDSGVVASDSSVGVEYAGDALQPASAYVWRADVVTTAGASSATSTFSTGLPGDADWAGAEWIGNAVADAASDLAFAGSSWIWTPEAGAPYAPAEPRAFRTTIGESAGRTAVSAEVIITADDSYRLWVDGALLGETTGAVNEWQGSKRFTVPLDGPAVVAVRTTNGPNSPAGLLAAIRVTFDDGTSAIVRSDASWKASKNVPDGFQAPGFDDSAWSAAAVQAAYGQGPWGSGVRAPIGTINPAPLLRTEFSVDKPVADAKMYVAAGGYADLSLNGEPINDEILSPGFTDYDDHAQYTVTDVTAQLTPGANAVGMQLGRGFYGLTNPNVWNWESAPFHDEPVGRVLLRITYTDGSSADVVSDGSWKIHDGPTRLDDLYGGETYDARAAVADWDTAGFDASQWTRASERSGPAGTLINQQQQPIRITEELPATDVTSVADGVWRVTFPRVIAGTVRFALAGPAGTTVRAQYGEKLRENGRVNFDNNGGFANGFQTDRFTLAGTGAAETWNGRFSYKGFQYIEVSGWPGDQAPPLSAFTALVLHTDAEETGSFESSNDIMNRTHRAVVDTLLNNIHSIPTDTPMFEKNGWTGDAAVGGEMFLMNLDTQNLFEKWVGDMDDSRDANGAPLVIAPSSDQWGQWGVAQPWHTAYVIIPWWLYQYGGNTQVLSRYYDNMARYVDLEYSRSPNGVARENRLGDWVSPEASPAGSNAPEDTRVSGTAYLYLMLTTMSKVATLLGEEADAARFDANAAVVKDGFNAAFFDPTVGYYRGAGDRGYRQTHNVLALALGLAPDAETAQGVADSIAADVTAKGDKLNTGTLGTKFLLPVLTEYGHADLAYRVAVQTGYPSWGYMLENGATSMWEHWAVDARSYGHYFLGTVDDWYFHDVAGIRSSTETGYRDITIKPALTRELDWAKATTPSPFGPVASDWTRDGDVLRLTTDIPVGSTAVVHLPTTTRWAATEGGVAVQDADGVRAVAEDGDELLVTVGSGHYEFVVDDAAQSAGETLALVDALSAEVEAAHESGEITDQAHAVGAARVADLRAQAVRALEAAGEAPDAAARVFAATLRSLGEVDAWLDALGDGVAVDARQRAGDVRTALDATISRLLRISLVVTPDRDGYKPGEAGALRTTVANAGSTAVSDVSLSLSGLDADWGAPGAPVALTPSLAPAAEESADLAFTVPADHDPAQVSTRVRAAYTFEGVPVGIPVDTAIVVDSPIEFASVAIEPSVISPGQSAEVVAVVRNLGAQPAVGRLGVTTPDGWVDPLDSVLTAVPAGGEATIRVPVFAPLGQDRTSVTARLGLAFSNGAARYATAEATLGVELAPVPADAYDHVDLGDSTSEQAHGLTASASSGTNTEAGLTRRYAGHLTDFSFFEFDVAVREGEPFVLRSTETYDRAQTKRYTVYVDGEPVTTRLYPHTDGVGAVTWEMVVPAEFASSDRVRVRFENGDDHSYYDPSIADVWTMPVPADTTAPSVVATTDPPRGAASEWFTTAPVSADVEARDDRDAAPAVEIALGDGDWTAYTAPVAFTDDGVHVVRYRASDAAGNTSVPAELTVRIDSAPPTTTATLGDGFEGDPPTATAPASLTLSAEDATSGVARTEYRANDGPWQAGTEVTLDTAGENTVEYRSVDVAGNVEQTQSVTVVVEIPDTVAPTVTASISNEGRNGWYLGGAALTLDGADDRSDVALEYRFGEAAWVAYDGPVTLPEGETRVSYRATDAAGNVSVVGAQDVRVDATAPEAWGWLSDTGRLTVVASDPGDGIPVSGPALLQYSLDGETWVDGIDALVRADAAPASVWVRAEDVAGNRSEVRTLVRTAAPGPLTVRSGEQLLVQASGFVPGQKVRIELHSDPVVLGTTRAGTTGAIAAFVTVPVGISGEHQLVLVAVDPDGQPAPGGSITVPTDVLARTGGGDAQGWLLLAGLLTLAGAGLVIASRRRRRGDAAPGEHSAHTA